MTGRRAPVWLQRLTVWLLVAAVCAALWGLLFLCIWAGVNHTNAARIVGKWVAVIIVAVLAGVFGERFRQWNLRREQAAHLRRRFEESRRRYGNRCSVLPGDRFDVFGDGE